MAEENSKAERDTVMDLSLYYQKGQRESNCFTYLIWVPVNTNKQKKNISLALKYWEKKENYFFQKLDTLNTAIYLPVDMPFLKKLSLMR